MSARQQSPAASSLTTFHSVPPYRTERTCLNCSHQAVVSHRRICLHLAGRILRPGNNTGSILRLGSHATDFPKSASWSGEHRLSQSLRPLLQFLRWRRTNQLLKNDAWQPHTHVMWKRAWRPRAFEVQMAGLHLMVLDSLLPSPRRPWPTQFRQLKMRLAARVQKLRTNTKARICKLARSHFWVRRKAINTTII